MKKQVELGLNLSTGRTRKAMFFGRVDVVVPWSEMCRLLETALCQPTLC
jgi:hypothetical protein